MAQKIAPSFSIIIPTLNEARYLPRLLKDLSLQTFTNFEVIIVDGHSEDDTVKKALLFKKSLPSLKIISSTKRHVCTQRNLGATHARSPWLIFMDADNSLPPYFLQGIKYRLEIDPADIATCYLEPDSNISSDKSIALAINIGHELLKNTTRAQIMEAMVITSKNAFSTIGGFDESINLAEGNAFAQGAFKHNLVYKTYKDPTYTYSFRRFRKFGILGIVGPLAQNEIAKLFDIPLSDKRISELYPMRGGNFFDLPLSKRNKFATSIQKLIKDLRSPDILKNTISKLIEE